MTTVNCSNLIYPQIVVREIHIFQSAMQFRALPKTIKIVDRFQIRLNCDLRVDQWIDRLLNLQPEMGIFC
jgi:hypothetical protein